MKIRVRDQTWPRQFVEHGKRGIPTQAARFEHELSGSIAVSIREPTVNRIDERLISHDKT